ncbi:putative quinol monooxygenase [Muriicola marianensis]|uniref:Antibiotic biosynthesis monooxygenase n=1 Tax=Muriicola marianensis TaxID=1324801 RepID=A0ABQ1QT08_9FLAO|nr:antibiotic biosynthesis monooxygenase family protein [Muriicola marianensis]GGD40739.1 antibiotic biosynthesis monooxygenase [Muriicola marianensis]
MITRIVKLHFKKENISSFERIFGETRDVIRNFDGCVLLELYQDTADPSTFFTYSKWETEEDLEAYRNSDFFKVVWANTKKLFRQKAEAWSVQHVHK